MKYDPQIHHRRSIRLRAYDYGGIGAYFLTLCAFNKECLFGQIADGQMRLNNYGQAVHEEWFQSARIRREIELDTFMVMPNHFHAIVRIVSVGAQSLAPLPTRAVVGPGTQSLAPLPTRAVVGPGTQSLPPLRLPMLRRKPRSLASFVWGLKTGSTKRINALRSTPGRPVWQRNYYEHIIRNEDELNKIREYIATNPLRWARDRENAEAETFRKEPWEAPDT